METIVKGMCNTCSLGCERDIHIKNGRVIRTSPKKEHKLTNFFGTCHTPATAATDGWVYSEDRVLKPLQKVGDKWREVTWHHAMDFIAQKLEATKAEYGPRSLAVYCGPTLFNTHMDRIARRFCDAYGTPNFASSESFCYFGLLIGHSLTVGAYMLPNFEGNRCYIVWGKGLVKDFAPSAITKTTVSKVRERSEKLIVVDPRKTDLAEAADIHVQLKPGSDAALALGLLNVVITQELYDKDFVAQWTVGFDHLVEHVRLYPPERVAQMTWVPAQTIIDCALMYAENKPSIIDQGTVAASINDTQASRALAILTAITGNWDIPGGNTYTELPPLDDLRIHERLAPETAIGADYPLYHQYVFTPQTVATPWLDAMRYGNPYPLKALIVHAANPMMTWPNAKKLEEGLRNLDLFVAIELFMTETSKLADIILPGVTSFERRSIKAYNDFGLPLVSLAEQAIEPLGECLNDWVIWMKLAKRLGMAKYFPWKSDDELFEAILKPSRISLAQLIENPGGIFYAPREFRRYLKRGFTTPSGKVEIFSDTMKCAGYDPLPTYHEEQEPEEYPFILMTGVRSDPFWHARGRRIPQIREKLPYPLLQINHQTASKIGVENGDAVRIQSPLGCIQAKARLSSAIDPRVVSLPHGWAEANACTLISDRDVDPVTGMPALRKVFCRLSKGDYDNKEGE